MIAYFKYLEQEYKNACIKVADATEAWNRTWKITCDVCICFISLLSFIHLLFFLSKRRIKEWKRKDLNFFIIVFPCILMFFLLQQVKIKR